MLGVTARQVAQDASRKSRSAEAWRERSVCRSSKPPISGSMFYRVRVHSRPIHLLLADVNMDARVPILKEHRSELQVLLVKKPVDTDDMLAKVRQLLGSPPPFLPSIR